MSWTVGRRAGVTLVAVAVLAAGAAPFLAPHDPDTQFDGLLNAPPTGLHATSGGVLRAPFIYRWQLASQLEQRYDEDRSAPISLSWFANGRLVRSSDEQRMPLLLLGTDSYGRDLFSRLLFGARISLGLAGAAAIGSLLLGLVVGGVAGYAGGALDEALMRASDLLMVLPATYAVLALRAVLPLVLPPQLIFALLSGIFAIVGAPFIARGVRGIVRSERRLDYAAAAEALGANGVRILTVHLLPATRGFLVVQLTLLVPAFIVAEATLSFVGLGFPDPVASWGTMLHDASNIRVFADFPWLLSPAIAMFFVVLALNLALQHHGTVVYNDPDEPGRRLRSRTDAV